MLNHASQQPDNCLCLTAAPYSSLLQWALQHTEHAAVRVLHLCGAAHQLASHAPAHCTPSLQQHDTRCSGDTAGLTGPPLQVRVALERVITTPQGNIVACWQVVGGAEPAAIRACAPACRPVGAVTAPSTGACSQLSSGRAVHQPQCTQQRAKQVNVMWP